MIDERELREMLERRAGTISATPTDAPKAIRRARRRLARNAAVGTLVGLAVLAGASPECGRSRRRRPRRTCPRRPHPTRAPPGWRGHRVRALGAGPGWDLAAQDPEQARSTRSRRPTGSLTVRTARCRNFIKVAEWSSDGRWVAFDVSSTSSMDELCAVRRSESGSRARSVTPTADDAVRRTPRHRGRHPLRGALGTWSPVGARLAYARSTGGPTSCSSSTHSMAVRHLSERGWTLTTIGVVARRHPDRLRDGGSRVRGRGGWGETVAVGLVRSTSSTSPGRPTAHRSWSTTRSEVRVQDMNADGSDLHPVLQR